LEEDCFDSVDVEVIIWVIGDLIGETIVTMHCRTHLLGIDSVIVRVHRNGVGHDNKEQAKKGDVDRLMGWSLPEFLVGLVKDGGERGMTHVGVSEVDLNEFVDDFLFREVGEQLCFVGGAFVIRLRGWFDFDVRVGAGGTCRGGGVGGCGVAA